jgi:hypothetical protein
VEGVEKKLREFNNILKAQGLGLGDNLMSGLWRTSSSEAKKRALACLHSCCTYYASLLCSMNSVRRNVG